MQRTTPSTTPTTPTTFTSTPPTPKKRKASRRVFIFLISESSFKLILMDQIFRTSQRIGLEEEGGGESSQGHGNVLASLRLGVKVLWWRPEQVWQDCRLG